MTGSKGSEILAPARVKWLCMILFTLGLLQVAYTFTGYSAGYGMYYPAIMVLLIVGSFAALSGILYWEGWGFWLYLVTGLGRVALDLFTGATGWLTGVCALSMIFFAIELWRKNMRVRNEPDQDAP